jgi:hypothetical protein
LGGSKKREENQTARVKIDSCGCKTELTVVNGCGWCIGVGAVSVPSLDSLVLDEDPTPLFELHEEVRV